jgi:3',5'-cyclic AMP phosphodiesterase CpdA
MYAHVRFATLALLFVSTNALAQSSVFESGPYLSQLTSHSVVVRVETETPEELVLTAEPGKERVAEDAARANVHSLVMENLQPKTTYRYTVTSNRGGHEDGTFTTAPPDDDTSDIHFVLYGDARGGVAVHQSIARRILDEPADFLVNTGDLVADGRSVALWENFFDIEDKLLRERCLFSAIGNHELVEDSGASFLRYFGTPEQQQKHVFYNTFRWGFLRVFVLNGEGTFLAEDRAWLERELAKSDAEANVAWRIVVIHDGPFTSGLHGDNDKLHTADVPKLFRDHHVDFVLEGHDHIYERGASDGMRYVVSGGAGAPLYPIRHVRATTRKVESAYNYVLFDFARDYGKLVAKRVDGSVIEDVGFTHDTMWSDDAVKPLPTLTATAPTSSASSNASGEASPTAKEEKESSNGVLYFIAGLGVVVAAWFWVTRRKRN